jgi:molybdate transport system substrate-binding protein
MSIARRAALFALLSAALVWPGAAPAQQRDIVVFAAASLKNALDDVVAAWGRSGGRKVVVSYAASSALARQIEQGAPADLFVSADLDWMDYADQRRAIRPETRRNLLGNRLVLVAPADKARPVAIAAGFDLAALIGDGRLAVGAVGSVPAGKYAKAALETLGAWEGVKGRLAEAESVRAALVLVARGEAPYGIVYATDAIAEKGVAVVGTFPETSHPPIVYPVALTSSAGPDAAAFLAFMTSAAARPAYEGQGFTVLDGR